MADRPTSIPDVLSMLDNNELTFTILAKLDFADGTVNLWLGPRNKQVTYNSEVWTGTGDLASIEKIREIEGIAEEKMIATLHATSDMLDTIELENNEGKFATFYIVVIDKVTRMLIGHIETRREMGAAWVEPKMIKQDDEHILVTDIKMELIGEGDIMARTFVRYLDYIETLEIDPNDHFFEFIADPDMARGQQGSMGMRLNGAISEKTDTQLGYSAYPVIK